MASNKNDDENDCRSTSSDRQRHAMDTGSADEDDPARDFMPPRSYVRKRQIPIYHSPTHTGRSEVDEGLAAWKAVNDQLSRGNARQLTGGREGNNRKSVNRKVGSLMTFFWRMIVAMYVVCTTPPGFLTEYILLPPSFLHDSLCCLNYLLLHTTSDLLLHSDSSSTHLTTTAIWNL